DRVVPAKLTTSTQPSNFNVMGTPTTPRTQTVDADFTTVANVNLVRAGVSTTTAAVTPFNMTSPPNGFVVVGMNTDTVNAAFNGATSTVPTGTQWVQTTNMQYPSTSDGSGNNPDDLPNGMTVLLRRLANPHIPPNPNPVSGGQPNPWFNPYITIDYLE